MRSLLRVTLLAAPASADKFCGKEIDVKTIEIECDDKSVSDLSPLKAATNLEELDVIGLPVSDLAPLAGLTKLRKLQIRMTKVTKPARHVYRGANGEGHWGTAVGKK